MLVFQGSKTNKTYDSFTPRTPQLLLPSRFSSCSVCKKWIASCHLGISCPTIWGNLASWPIIKIYPKYPQKTSKSSTHLEFVLNVFPRVILIWALLVANNSSRSAMSWDNMYSMSSTSFPNMYQQNITQVTSCVAAKVLLPPVTC